MLRVKLSILRAHRTEQHPAEAPRSFALLLRLPLFIFILLPLSLCFAFPFLFPFLSNLFPSRGDGGMRGMAYSGFDRFVSE